MRKLYSIMILLLVATKLSAQQLHLDWTRYIGGDSTCGVGAHFAIATSDGGILFTGLTNCNNTGQMPPISYSGTNAFIGKIDNNQNISWIYTFGGTSDDFGRGACETADGGYAVIIRTTSDDGDVVGSHGSGEIWLLRFNQDGNLLWKKCYGSTWDEPSLSIVSTPENGLLILGTSTGPGDDVPDHYGPTQFYNDWFVVKTDSAGNIMWGKIYGGSANETVIGSILVANNNYYLVGTSESKDHDCVDTLWHSNVNTGSDNYILKLDTAGNLVWSKSYGGSNTETARHAIYDDRDSSIVVVGETLSNNYMVTNNHGAGEIWIMKTDLDGNLLWGNCLGQSGTQYGRSICKAEYGGYIVAALAFSGEIGAQDGWISYVDNMGQEQTHKFFGTTGNETIYSVVPYLNGYVITGSTTSPNFTEGQNIGYTPLQNIAYMPLSYFDYWPVGVKEDDQKIEKKDICKIYPNPAMNELHVKYEQDVFFSLSIVDARGRELIRKTLIDKKTTVDIQQLTPGVYFIILEGEQGREMQRFVKY